MESLQAWGFALRATTPQVAFGYDPTGHSVLNKFKMTEYLTSTFKIHDPTFDIRFFATPEACPRPWKTAGRQVDRLNQTRAIWEYLPVLLFPGFHHPA